MLEDAQEEPALPKDLKHIPYQYIRLPEKEMLSRASEFYQMAAARRTLRYFSADPVSKVVIREIIRAAGTCVISVLNNIPLETYQYRVKKKYISISSVHRAKLVNEKKK